MKSELEVKAWVYADDFMRNYRKMQRIVERNHGKPTAIQFKKLVEKQILR